MACTRLTLTLPVVALLAAPAAGAEYWLPLGDGAGQPAVVRNGDGRMEVFVRRSDGAIWHVWQDPALETGWSSWSSLGGSFAGGPLAGGCGGSCTTTVCASRSYCCQTLWDQTCVDAARTQCDVAAP